MDTRASGLKGDFATAAALALALGAGWTARDWPALRALRLPDTDDVMRLQQVRDWLAGQRFADLVQHRLGAGVPMHWTRLADLGPAALIESLTPIAGRHAAEIAAVIAWPILLFALALALVARVARIVAGPGAARTAAVVAAVAYPATTIFLPGRIDHHGLQLVLLLGALLATVGPPTIRRGLAAGGCAAASLVVGLETAPLLATLGAAAACLWATGEREAERRLLGWGAGALAGLAIGRLFFAPDAFAYPACDGFTLDAWRAAGVAALGAGALGVIGTRRPVIATGKRWAMLLSAAAAVALAAVAVSPRCLSPYGGVDPLVARLWLAHVGEAQSLFTAPAATAIGYAGVMTVGLAATAWRWRTVPGRGWAVLLAVQLAATLVTLAQLRGAYAGAMLGAPALAAAIGVARARSALALAGAWLASAGMLYPIAAAAATRGTPGIPASTACGGPALVDRLAQLPAGTLLAPIDTGARVIAATRLSAVAGPYHRDNAGNRALYAFFGSAPARSRAIAHAWHVHYVAFCPGDLDAAAPPPSSLGRHLEAGAVPPWLAPLPAPAGARLYAVRP